METYWGLSWHIASSVLLTGSQILYHLKGFYQLGIAKTGCCNLKEVSSNFGHLFCMLCYFVSTLLNFFFFFHVSTVFVWPHSEADQGTSLTVSIPLSQRIPCPPSPGLIFCDTVIGSVGGTSGNSNQRIVWKLSNLWACPVHFAMLSEAAVSS